MIDVRPIKEALGDTTNAEEVLALTRKSILSVGRAVRPTPPTNPVEKNVFEVMLKGRFQTLTDELEACEALCEIFRADYERETIKTIGDSYEKFSLEVTTRLVRLVADTVRNVRKTYKL